MAIRVLLDHGASEENIGFGCLGCTQQGLKNIRKAFPKVSVFTQKLVDYDINNGPRLKL